MHLLPEVRATLVNVQPVGGDADVADMGHPQDLR